MCNNYKKQQKADEYCFFCAERSKISTHFGRWVCPNGHILLTPDNEKIVKQPMSGTNPHFLKARNVFRRTNDNGLLIGRLCGE